MASGDLRNPSRSSGADASPPSPATRTTNTTISAIASVQAAAGTPPSASQTLPGQSQESVASEPSVGASAATAPALQYSSSNLSTSTVPESVLTSPATSVGVDASQERLVERKEAAMAAATELSQVQAFPSVLQPQIPRESGMQNATLDGVASPMAIERPHLNQAAKRTASGSVKPSVSSAPAPTDDAGAFSGHARSSSAVDGVNKLKIAELSSQLKTRLSYAMVKVQNGWENRSLEELERAIMSPQQTQGQRAPMTPTGSRHGSRPVTSSTFRSYGPSYSERSQRYLQSPGAHSPPPGSAGFDRTSSSSSNGDGGPSADSPTTYAGFWANNHSAKIPPASMRTHAHHASTSTIASSAPSLAPPVDLVPTVNRTRRSYSNAAPRRTNHGRFPSTLSASSDRPSKRVQGSPPALKSPATPTSAAAPVTGIAARGTPRKGPLRMPSQQAEKDAVDTLLFMSSPNNSSNMKHGPGQGPGSPLRDAF